MEEQTNIATKTNQSKGCSFLSVMLGAWGMLILLFVLIPVLLYAFRTEISGFVLEYLSAEEQTDSERSQLESKILDEESTIIDVVRNAQDSVVSIAVKQVELDDQLGPLNSDNNIGTGFAIEEDLIITNQHVVDNSEADYTIVTNDSEVFEVESIASDELNDIAFIKVKTNGKKLKPLILGDSSNLKIGQLVIAIGTPLGDYPGTATTGIVSGLDRSVEVGSSFFNGNSKKFEGVIQTDAAINPGNSGGPLLDSEANVIGVNFATSNGADNISFAIPISIVSERLSDYRASGGKLLKPYLGVSYQVIDDFDAFRFEIPKGVLIAGLDDDGPAVQAGVLEGDIISKVNGEDVSESGLQITLLQYRPGEEVELEIWRKTGETYSEGEFMTIKVVLIEREEER